MVFFKAFSSWFAHRRLPYEHVDLPWVKATFVPAADLVDRAGIGEDAMLAGFEQK